MVARSRLVFIILTMSFISILFSLSKGSTSIALYQLFNHENGLFSPIFLQLRLPRTIAAFTCGGLLALAGVFMQLLLRNPLADPYVLGVSGGAAFFTLLLMLVGVSAQWLMGGAWLGSLLTIILIFLLAKKHQWQPHTLLLCGIAIAGGFSAGISLILLMSDAAHLHSMLFWLSGDLNETAFPWLGLTVLSIGFVISMMLAPGLNLLVRGEIQARALGLASQHYKLALYVLSSLFTATSVTMAGCIGFIGLIIPHLTRQLSGYDHRFVIPLSLLLGGSLLTLADTFARTIIAPQQLPVGMVMALIGVPLFVWLLQR